MECQYKTTVAKTLHHENMYLLLNAVVCSCLFTGKEIFNKALLFITPSCPWIQTSGFHFYLIEEAELNT